MGCCQKVIQSERQISKFSQLSRNGRNNVTPVRFLYDASMIWFQSYQTIQPEEVSRAVVLIDVVKTRLRHPRRHLHPHHNYRLHWHSNW
jgi:hypothetical protein